MLGYAEPGPIAVSAASPGNRTQMTRTPLLSYGKHSNIRQLQGYILGMLAKLAAGYIFADCFSSNQILLVFGRRTIHLQQLRYS
jgi:hypothetical protein